MFAQIEKLKREYTDKYVVVAADRPELARFAGHTGQVKTVNMSGRALVEFDVWASIGWYDIDVSFLHVVPKPEPKAETEAKEAPRKAAPAKPAAESKPAGESKPAAEAAKPAAKPAGAKPSVADILAAARANKAGAAAAPKAPSAPAAKPAGAPPAKGKPSTAEILAAARTKKGPAALPAETSGEVGDAVTTTAEVVAEAPPAPAPAAEKAAVKPAASKPAGGGSLPTDTAGRIAWCREHDKR